MIRRLTRKVLTNWDHTVVWLVTYLITCGLIKWWFHLHVGASWAVVAMYATGAAIAEITTGLYRTIQDNRKDQQ